MAETGSKSSASAFLQAVSAGDVESTRRGLQSRDCRRLVAALDSKQRGCAHIASIAGHAEVLRLLNNHGFEMEAGDRIGRTPLHLACENGKAAAAECLLDCGARPGLQDSAGRTALHLAVCCQDPQICRSLVSKFPQLVFRNDRNGRTPLFYSCLGLHASAAGEASRLLLEQLADMNQRDNHARVPLHYAAEEGRLDAVQLLLKLRADPRAEDLEGQTALNLTSHGAVQNLLRKALGLPHSSGSEAAATATAAGRPHPAAASSHAIPPGAPPGPSKSPRPAAGPHGSGARPQSAGPAREPTTAAVPRPLPPLGRPPTAVAGSEALGNHFQQLQSRFVQIMERVQQGGLDQMEHIKRPHVFTGSWMMDVSSHQQLLGQALRYVPGPEVCLRIFNLLRPPKSFPCARGDERAIMSYYSDGTAAPPAWAAGGVEDPYLTGAEKIEDGGISHGRREELLKAIRDQRQQLDAKEEANQELRQKLERFQAELALGLDSEEAKLLRGRLANANAQLTAQVAEVEDAKCQARVLEGEKAVLVRQLQEEKANNTQLIDEHCAIRQKLEAQYQLRGEEKSWQECFQQEAEKYEVLRRKLEAQVQQAWERTNAAEHREAKALAEMQQLRQLARDGQELPAAKEQVERAKSELQASRQTEQLLRGQLDALRPEFERCKGELQEANSKAMLLPEQQQRVQQVEARLSEAEPLAAQVPLLQKQLEVRLAEAKQEMEDRLRNKDQEMDRETKKWMSAWSNYPLIGQMLFGGAPLGGSLPQHPAGATMQSVEGSPQATMPFAESSPQAATGPGMPSAESFPKNAVVEQPSPLVADADALNLGATLRPTSAGACAGTQGLAAPVTAAALPAAGDREQLEMASQVLSDALGMGGSRGTTAQPIHEELISSTAKLALAAHSKATEDKSTAADDLAAHAKAMQARSNVGAALAVLGGGGSEEVEDDHKLRMLTAGGTQENLRKMGRGLLTDGFQSGFLEDALQHAEQNQAARDLGRGLLTDGFQSGFLEDALKDVLAKDPGKPPQATADLPEVASGNFDAALKDILAKGFVEAKTDEATNAGKQETPGKVGDASGGASSSKVSGPPAKADSSKAQPPPPPTTGSSSKVPLPPSSKATPPPPGPPPGKPPPPGPPPGKPKPPPTLPPKAQAGVAQAAVLAAMPGSAVAAGLIPAAVTKAPESGHG